MPPTIHELNTRGVHRALRVEDAASGLRAYIILDDLTLGPAAGGVRTRLYPSDEAAMADARQLARAMTLKCAISGLDAGGGKAVVLDHKGLDRPRAFRALGEAIASLGGDFRSAGDVGTVRADLAAMAEVCPWIHTDERSLANSVARGLLASIRGAQVALGLGTLEGKIAAVQGAGSIGSATTRALRRAGAEVCVSDLNEALAQSLAEETGAQRVPVDAIFAGGAHILVPCALGGVVDRELATTSDARLICGGANNPLADPGVERLLMERGVGFVPAFISSAGAVIDGIGQSVMGLADRGPLIDRLADIAQGVLEEARDSRRPSAEVANAWALRRLAGEAMDR